MALRLRSHEYALVSVYIKATAVTVETPSVLSLAYDKLLTTLGHIIAFGGDV